jgi:hypothetical protein
MAISMLLLFQFFGTAVHAAAHEAEHITSAISDHFERDHHHVDPDDLDAHHSHDFDTDHEEDSSSRMLHHAVHAAASMFEHIQLFSFDPVVSETTAQPIHHFAVDRRHCRSGRSPTQRLISLHP